MSKNHFTADQLKDMAADYFTSNPDADYLVASTHDGIFYRPENAGYAQSGASAHGGQLVKVNRAAEAVQLTSQVMNVNIQNLSVHTLNHVDDLTGFLSANLARVANGEDPAKVLEEMMANVPPTVELTVRPEHEPASGLVEALAGALHLPGFLVPAGNLSDAPQPIAPAPKPAAKKTAAPKAAKSPKTKASTKTA